MIVYHNNHSIKTIKELMEEKNIFETEEFTYETFFEENKLRIFQQLSDEERCKLAEEKYGKDASIDDLTVDDLHYDMVLPCPCTLLIDSKYVTTNLSISETNFQENTDDFFVFQKKEINRIVNNKSYQIELNVSKKRPDVKVFGFFKSLYRVLELNGNVCGTSYSSNFIRFLPISKYIIYITTNVSQNGGTFKITLPIINMEKSSNGYDDYFNMSNFWNHNNNDDIVYVIKYFFGSGKNEFDFNKNNFFHKSTVNDFENNLFNYLIQSNDLLFIDFGDDIEMCEEDINQRCFDMIGLVDDVSVSQNSNGVGFVTVSGRDLMKLILEDSSLFFNKSTAWGGSNIFENIESYMKTGDILSSDMLGGAATPVDRLRRLTNEINIFAYPRKTLDFILKGVVSKLANIEVVPSNLFYSWGLRRTKFNELRYFDDNGNIVEQEYENEQEYNENEQIEVDEILNEGLNENNNVNAGGVNKLQEMKIIDATNYNM